MDLPEILTIKKVKEEGTLFFLWSPPESTHCTGVIKQKKRKIRKEKRKKERTTFLFFREKLLTKKKTKGSSFIIFFYFGGEGIPLSCYAFFLYKNPELANYW